MSSAVLKPSIAPMTPKTPQPYRWTCDEYRSLRGAGRFNDRRVMLIEGEILIMPLPDPPHNLSVGLIADWLRRVFTAGYHVRNQMAFDVGTRNDPGPDLAVVVVQRVLPSHLFYPFTVATRSTTTRISSTTLTTRNGTDGADIPKSANFQVGAAVVVAVSSFPLRLADTSNVTSFVLPWIVI